MTRSPTHQNAQPVSLPPSYTGERIDPQFSSGSCLQEHAARYVFAARYCAGKDILDVASGLGYGTDFLRRQGARVVGLEIDEPSVRYSIEKYPLARFVRGKAEQMPESWCEAFDVVVSFETIEHLKQPSDFLREVFRCLRPGGLFICSTPHKSLYLLQEENPFHVKEYYSREFVRFIGNWFRVREVFGQAFHSRTSMVLPYFLVLARKIMNGVRIPSLGIGKHFNTFTEYPSPFDGDSIREDKVIYEFMPSALRRGVVPKYLVVFAEKNNQ
jgi:SAM-dependent methyltransferase